MTWRVARSLDVLLGQVNQAYPGRSTASDGSVGDTSHQARPSDHNPDRNGVVKARDITHDPDGGLDASALVDALVASRDPRISYLIFDRRMWRSYAKPGLPAWTPSAYTGPNPHTKHVHVSVAADPDLYDDTRLWAIGVPSTHAEVDVAALPLLKRGAKGEHVETVQSALLARNRHLKHAVNAGGKDELLRWLDGDFGPNLEKAVREFQEARGVTVDGQVGGETWPLLVGAA